ncbi:MAG: phosphate acyltransferase PlsX [Candidatus Omnitrophica bacterium]|nr:phosphate acyltransferase PlsX [Candidatus Omnitrophota bacterium]MCM8826916.1 phosphate acyltransferase PlsX [Candidatus Omnitrophota bacterium]
MSYRVGIDISGGDYAPLEPLKGAIWAQEEIDDKVVLIGDKKEIGQTLEKLKDKDKIKIRIEDLEIVDAPEKIEMDDLAAMSIRKKRNSSIVVGIDLLKKGKIDAFVSCGNTGAVVSASTLMLRLIEGVERPGISVFVPTAKNVSLLIDVGANVNPKPLHLLQYGIMASLYYSLVLNKREVTVGLLNIGEEETKGPDFVRTVHKLFSSAPINFIGNLEAKDIFTGKCDCIICDGFVGNIALKLSEGLVEVVGKFLTDAIKNDPLSKLGLIFIRRSIRKFKSLVDYAEYGGAPLLGVNGVVIIGHGRSNSKAVKNAIKVAIKELNRDVIGEIRGRLKEIYENNSIKELISSATQ